MILSRLVFVLYLGDQYLLYCCYTQILVFIVVDIRILLYEVYTLPIL